MKPAGETGRGDELDLLFDGVAILPLRQIAIFDHPQGVDMAEIDPAEDLRRQIDAARPTQHDGQRVAPEILMQLGNDQSGRELAGRSPRYGNLPNGIFLFHINLATTHSLS